MHGIEFRPPLSRSNTDFDLSKTQFVLLADPLSIGACLSQLLYPYEPRHVLQSHFCPLKLIDNGHSCLYYVGWMRMEMLDSCIAVFQCWFGKILLY